MSEQERPANALDENLQAVNDSMLEGLGKLAEYFGYNKVMGQLFGALLLSHEPLSLDDLADALQKSKANVSTNMRTLENMGMAREVWVRGERRKFYEAETDFWKLAVNILSNRELRDLEQALHILQKNTEKLRAAMPDMDPDERELSELYVQRIDRLQELFRFAQLLLNSIVQRALAGGFDVSEVKRIIIE
ncbi:MAG: ArsR family transcriptional regulator [Anaerolineae bacterium]|nr:ArsR family transcriptional regulator [Anaerolineae bacterium]